MQQCIRLTVCLARPDRLQIEAQEPLVHCSSLSLIFHLLACTFRQTVSSRRCKSALKPLVRHAYIPIIVSPPGTRQQRANRMTLKYLSPTSLRRIKFGVGGNALLSRSTVCGGMCAHSHTHTHTHTSSFSGLCRLRQTAHVPSCSVEY